MNMNISALRNHSSATPQASQLIFPVDDEKANPSHDVLTRDAMRNRSVLVYGPSESPGLLQDTNVLLQFLQEECGTLVGAFRFFATAPVGYERPAFRTPVFLVVFENTASVDAALRLSGSWFDVYVLSVHRPTPVPPDAAETYLRLFLPAVLRTEPMPSVKPSTLLWVVVFSESSTYHVDWRAVRASARRFDAMIIDESKVIPLKPGMAPPDSVQPNANQRSGRDNNKKDSSGRTTATESFPYASSSSGGAFTTTSSSSMSTAPRFDMPSSVQQQYYMQRYGDAGGGEPFSQQGIAQAVARGFHSVVENFSQREEPLRMGGEAASYPQLRFPSVRGGGGDGGDGEAAPLLRRRRTESDRERRGERSDPTLVPKLNAIGSALTWMPGFKYLMPLFCADEEASTTQEQPAGQALLSAPPLPGRNTFGLAPDASQQRSAAPLSAPAPSFYDRRQIYSEMDRPTTTSTNNNNHNHNSINAQHKSGGSGVAYEWLDPRDVPLSALNEDSMVMQFATPQHQHQQTSVSGLSPSPIRFSSSRMESKVDESSYIQRAISALSGRGRRVVGRKHKREEESSY